MLNFQDDPAGAVGAAGLAAAKALRGSQALPMDTPAAAWEGLAPPPPRQQHQVQPPMAGRTLRAQSGFSVRGGESRSTQSLPTPRVSMKSAERAYSKVIWSNSESKQPR